MGGPVREWQRHPHSSDRERRSVSSRRLEFRRLQRERERDLRMDWFRVSASNALAVETRDFREIAWIGSLLDETVSHVVSTGFGLTHLELLDWLAANNAPSLIFFDLVDPPHPRLTL